MKYLFFELFILHSKSHIFDDKVGHIFKLNASKHLFHISQHKDNLVLFFKHELQLYINSSKLSFTKTNLVKMDFFFAKNKRYINVKINTNETENAQKK